MVFREMVEMKLQYDLIEGLVKPLSNIRLRNMMVQTTLQTYPRGGILMEVGSSEGFGYQPRSVRAVVQAISFYYWYNYLN